MISYEDITKDIENLEKTLKERKDELKEFEKTIECCYTPAYQSKCKSVGVTNIDDKWYCEKHRIEYCSCGKKATHECSYCFSMGVCGRPLCENCKCKH